MKKFKMNVTSTVQSVEFSTKNDKEVLLKHDGKDVQVKVGENDFKADRNIVLLVIASIVVFFTSIFKAGGKDTPQKAKKATP